MNGVVARGDDGGILNGNDGLNDNNVDILRRQDLVEADADIPINVDVRGDESQGGILNDNDVLEDNNVDVLKRKGGADVDVLKRQDDGGIVDADVDVDVDVAKRQVPNLVDVDTNADADVGEEA